jgi:hypothetical protein
MCHIIRHEPVFRVHQIFGPVYTFERFESFGSGQKKGRRVCTALGVLEERPLGMPSEKSSTGWGGERLEQLKKFGVQGFFLGLYRLYNET